MEMSRESDPTPCDRDMPCVLVTETAAANGRTQHVRRVRLAVESLQADARW